jgi:hypothetical protein
VGVNYCEAIEDCACVSGLTSAGILPGPQGGQIFGLGLREVAFRLQQGRGDPVNESAILRPLDSNCLYSFEGFLGFCRLALLKAAGYERLEQTQ